LLLTLAAGLRPSPLTSLLLLEVGVVVKEKLELVMPLVVVVQVVIEPLPELLAVGHPQSLL
jgi:hypothetical protein